MRATIFLGLCLGLATPVAAGDAIFSTKNRLDIFESQKRLLDTRAATQYEHSERLKPRRAGEGLGPRPHTGAYRGPYYEMARAAAIRHGIPVALFLNLVEQESNWDPKAVSPKGAIGLAQLMPDTAKDLGVDPHQPAENLDGGARYLAQQYRKFRSWRLALAAYNTGPDAVKAHDGIPPYRETMNYVKAIWGG